MKEKKYLIERVRFFRISDFDFKVEHDKFTATLNEALKIARDDVLKSPNNTKQLVCDQSSIYIAKQLVCDQNRIYIDNKAVCHVGTFCLTHDNLLNFF